MIRHCIVELSTGKVVNIVDYLSLQVGRPEGIPDGFVAVASNVGCVGAEYKDGVFILPDNRAVPFPMTWAESRRAEYPPAADYLDGVVKGDQAQIDKYIADCLAVKAKYPKP